MKFSKKFRAVVLPLLLISIASPLHAAKYTINWYLGHKNLDYFEEAAREFKMAVESRSGGEIEVRIKVADTDNSDAESIASKVQTGAVQMGHSFTDVMGQVDPRLLAFGAPYLMRDYRHMEGVIEGPIGAELLGGLSQKNMVGLCFTYSGGANGVVSVDREIRRPQDLKGLRVGYYGDAVSEAWLRELGAVPVAVGHARFAIQNKLQEGAIDAALVTWRNLERQHGDRDFRYFNLLGSSYLASMTYMNEAFFKSLPEAYQKIVKEESLKSARIERAKTIGLNEFSRREMVAGGVREVNLNRAARTDFEAGLQPAYTNSLDKLLGRDLIQGIRQTKDGPEFPVMPETVVRR